VIDDLILCTHAVEKSKSSIKSLTNPFLPPPEDDLSPHVQPKWFLASLPLPRLEAMLLPRGRPNGLHNNDSRPLLFHSDIPSSLFGIQIVSRINPLSHL
jgi:hypothetical protein